ncbi:KpsF/GutQ family sugar-phosphate isomerase [Amphiplicatus metriothermophilus]|nr:KpsF/GutQ family sugar-phosphate isomerase [Amphiplicatus metriothermophilus]MBB5517394.1 arabinose-5-phosphate isomerase [Amphiplicatus metriothermophilus]
MSRPKDEPDDLAVARRVLALQAEGLKALGESLDAAFSRAVETILNAQGRVICAGIGKSGHVARKVAATLASTGTPAYFVHPSEASHGDLGMIARGDVVLALSKSGETSELSDLIHYARRFAIPLLAITAAADSTLGRASDVALVIPPAVEACAETQAPTTSTTLMMALGDALAVALLERRGFKADSFSVLHPGGRLGAMLLRVSDLMHGGEALPLVRTGARLGEGLATISAKGFGCVGVVDGAGRLVGVITDGDVRRLLTAGARPETVDEAMTRAPVAAPPDALAASALRLMNARKITQIFVVENGAPVGIVHMHDLLRAGLR